MKNFLNTGYFKIAAGIIAGFIIGWLLKPSHQVEVANAGSAGEVEQVWTCSMHPQIRQNKPGKCPICGMDLIPLTQFESESQIPENAIVMTGEALALANVQTAVVARQTPEKSIYMLGKVKPDERLIFSQTAHIPGRIEKLYVSFTGERVKKGQKLAAIYSPELINAQKELFELKNTPGLAPELIEAARNKLRFWKFTEEQIAALENEQKLQTTIDVLSDFDGYVWMRHVSMGDYVKEGQTLFRIVDLNNVWVMLEAYESDLPWIKRGDKATIRIDAIPGKTFSGTITYIDPFINPQTRIAQVRVELPNPGTLLKPEMFARAVMHARLPVDTPVIIIPKSAVLWTGKRSIVYVKIPDATQTAFLMREVELGGDAGDSYIIDRGLKAGEEIAVYGVFRIDAAAQLAGKKSMMNPEGGSGTSGHHHGAMPAQGQNGQSGKGEMQRPLPVPEGFSQTVATLLRQYFALKDALVNDDFPKAKPVASALEKTLTGVDMSSLQDESHRLWMDISTQLKEAVESLKQSDDIDEMRQAFLHLSEAMIALLESFRINYQNTVYLDFCPMANDNKGGYWLSQHEKIENPYFGSQMLTCGKVEKKFFH